MSNNTVEEQNNPGNWETIRGTVMRAFPKKGYLWIRGEDEVSYFGHQFQIQNGAKVEDSWIGQSCTFVPKRDGSKGPYAEHIEMLD